MVRFHLIILLGIIINLGCLVEASWPHNACHLDSKIAEAVKSPQKLSELYEDYRIEHGVEHHSRETPKRLDIFKQFLHRVQEMEADEGVTWKVGITFMAHMTECEKSLYHGTNKTAVRNRLRSGGYPQLRAGGGVKLKKAFDWRKHDGGVTPIHAQKGPTCWAHAAVVPLEAQLYMLTGETKELSTQELVDCVYADSSDKTPGGSKEEAWFWIQDHHHLAKRSAIPDRSSVRACTWIFQRRHTNALSGLRIKFVRGLQIQGDDESELLQTLSTLTPVTVNMDTQDSAIDTYKGGPYDWRATSCREGSYHAMAMVGYDPQYYIIKNSWGTGWGDQGYLWWVRTPVSQYNCGLFQDITFPWMVYKEDLVEEEEENEIEHG